MGSTDGPRWIGRLPVRLVLAIALTTPLVAGTDDVAADVLAKDIQIEETGPLGGVTVFGDSVLLGSGLWGPTLPDRLAEEGWGPIRFKAGVGYRTGKHTNGNRTIEASWWIERWRSEGWDPPNVIVNLGANDSGICTTDLTCAKDSIMHVVDAIGAGHSIWWPQITRAPVSPFVDQMNTWNQALDEVAADLDHFHTWDWPQEMATGGYTSSDGVHLSVDGYRQRSVKMAEEFTAVVAMATRTGPDEPLPQTASPPSTFVALTPQRVIDTRHDPPGRRPDGSTLEVDFGSRLPAGTRAVAVNVTAAGPSEEGFLSAVPCGEPVGSSTVNFEVNESRGAMAVTPLGVNGRLCVFNRGATDVIVDLQGAFVEGPDEARLDALVTQQRLVDTRQTGRSSMLVVPTPPGASAVAVNLTAVDAAETGWLRASPCGSTTGVSNVNFGPGEDVAGAAFVATSAADTICVESSVSVDVIVDLTGTFGPTGLSFVPVIPARMLDTRSGVGGWEPVQGAEQIVDIRVAPPTAKAMTGTITIVGPLADGFLLGYPCGPLPATSSVNAEAGQILANAVTTAVRSGGRLCVYASQTGNSLVDVAGWWIP